MSQGSACTFTKVTYEWLKDPLPTFWNNHLLERYYKTGDDHVYVLDTPPNSAQATMTFMVKLNGTYTINTMITENKVSNLEFSCVSYKGDKIHTNLKYKCLSDTKSCDFKIKNGTLITTIDYLTCDGKEHTISNYDDWFMGKAVSCGNYDYGILNCEERVDITMLIDYTSITYNETDDSLFSKIKSGMNLDIDLGSLSVWDKVKSVIMIILYVALLILLIYLAVKFLLPLITRLIKSFKLKKSESAPILEDSTQLRNANGQEQNSAILVESNVDDLESKEKINP